MNTSSHFNPDVIQELRMVMGEDFAGLLRTFLVDSAQRVDAIAATVQAADADALRRAAHSFKGSAGNMGAIAVAELCRQLEELGRSGTTAGAAELVAQLRREFAAVEQEVKALLPH